MTETCRHSPGESDEALRAGQRPSMRQTMTQLQRVAPVAARLTVASTAAALTGRAREPWLPPRAGTPADNLIYSRADSEMEALRREAITM